MRIETDYLIIGSGIAGLWAALEASAHGRVVVVTKKENAESNTNYAQGGIASVFAPDDSYELHIQDTLNAGAGLCHRDAVEMLVREGPDRVRELIAVGARFNTETLPDGSVVLALGREGGHSRRRIVHAADLTGREIERACLAAVEENPKISIFENHLAIDLVALDGQCLGVIALDRQTRVVKVFLAKGTVVATGGLGRLYRHTTNPPIATGDGLAMCRRIGAKIANMEFIQFHPTTLYHPDADSFLISEAVRGEGGVLRLPDGSTFMEKYHPMKSLAPRDVVARAIHAELMRLGAPCVYLDVTHLEPERIKTRFPNIYAKCLSFGIDMTKQWIPIVPAAHYSCGGVLTDKEGRTSVPRLYAVGEVACTGVHGANRLASNSLLEAVVFAEHAAADMAHLTPVDFSKVPPLDDMLQVGTEEPDMERVSQLTRELQTCMWEDVGIVRTNAGLSRALDKILSIKEEAEAEFRRCRLAGALLELRNMATAAELIVRCAIMRKESRGLHYNIDYPNTDPAWAHDTIIE
jgi:L-aspartate oxidase